MQGTLPDGYRVATHPRDPGPWLNRLAEAHSPYLRQHAHNPVDWMPWGPDAFARAQALGRPIFLSIGYAACHWCHVMERESFTDPAIAALLNECFVSIKVDREEHPQVDALYMDALIELTGEGGWPANLFLSPEGLPFAGGTYFPPYARYGLPSFADQLGRVADRWGRDPEGVRRGVAVLEERLAAGPPGIAGLAPVAGDPLDHGLGQLLDAYDREGGGWGGEARFPHIPRLDLLLTVGAIGAGPRAEEARQLALHLLDTLERSGIHDQLGGGLHRYATDSGWELPHFEKMLIDNALAARASLRAWSIWRRPRHLAFGASTLEYMLRDLLDDDGLFFASQDADDPLGEGHYYSWTQEELVGVVGPRLGRELARATGADRGGVLEGGRAVLRRLGDPSLLAAGRTRLLAARALRPPPATDHKKVVAWNGAALSALAHGAAFTGDPRYLLAGRRLAGRLLGARGADGLLPRIIGPQPTQGVLDDQVATIEGLLDLHAADGDPVWLGAADGLMHAVLERFVDGEGVPRHVPQPAGLFLRRPRWQDDAEPASSALCLLLLGRLAAMGASSADQDRLVLVRDASISAISSMPMAAPTALRAILLSRRPPRTVVVGGAPGPTQEALRSAAGERWRPDLQVLAASPDLGEAFAALHGKPVVGPARAWPCEGVACGLPVGEAGALRARLDGDP